MSTRRLLTPDRVARELQLTTTELAARRRTRRAPAWIRLSSRTIRYHPDDVTPTS